MRPWRQKVLWIVVVVVAVALRFGWLHGQSANRLIPLGKEEAADIGMDAYIYGYPLVTMEMTRRVMTNAAQPGDLHAPMGQFALARKYPDAAFHDVIAPNTDTLYSTAWLDVEKEPYVLTIPDSGGRYYLMPMLDGWTNVFQSPGKRTTGTAKQVYAITGPGWTGALPAGVIESKSPTNIVWILGRTYCSGTPDDYKRVHAFQDGLSLVPLSAYGKPYTPPQGRVDPSIDMKTPVQDQVNSLTVADYFQLLAELMKENPPAPADAPIVRRMARIGLVPGRSFDMTSMDPIVVKALQDIPKAALAEIMGNFKPAAASDNGWNITLKTGDYGTSYLDRALTTAIGLGANRPEDAVYPTSESDANGKPYNGSKQYVMHFEKGELPPVNAFWSLTLYNGQYFFVPNPLNRYSLGSRDKLKYNADGSLDLYLQASNPGPDKESNWIPAPSDPFVLMMRLYWPKSTPPSILTGTWRPPAVTPRP